MKTDLSAPRFSTAYLFVIAIALLTGPSLVRAAALPDDYVTAKAAILVDAHTGATLYEKNADLPLPPASTTKVMTAIVAIEQEPLTAHLRVTKNATQVSPCKISVRPGEQWKLNDLLRCLLLNSANDAGVVIAEGSAGSVKNFALLMNRKAHALGATHTHFANPHGLDQANHYSTVRDMTLIFEHAVQIPVIREILQVKRMSFRGPQSRLVHLRNHNRLLGKYPGMVCGKTGYTSRAQRCFVGMASRGKKSLFVCVFGSQNHFRDASKLLDYGFGLEGNEWAETTVRAVPSDDLAPGCGETQNSAYLLQVASFTERWRANDLKKVLVDQGYPAFVKEGPARHKRTWYRVKVGSYPDLESASQGKEQIKKLLGLHPIVLNVEGGSCP
jgi:serine-type D-Ala-D-Ala carboxypeptidase (penicillin-binding protein 5/6)